MEIEPAEWPDFSTATITDAAPIHALVRALAERLAAVGETMPNALFPNDYDPSLSRLEALRSSLRSIASKFVRMDDDYQWMSWAEFPRTFSSSDLMRGDHSLAILPARADPDADVVQLDVYRVFLANCAWWLRQFRYVDARSRSFFTRKATASGGIYITEYNGVETRTGDEPDDVLDVPTILQQNNDADVDMVVYLHREIVVREDVYYSSGWSNDAWKSQERSIEATVYSGLVVRNYSGLDARLLLVPCFHYERYSTPFDGYELMTESLTFIDTLIPASMIVQDDDKFAGKFRMIDTVSYRHGIDWKEHSREAKDGDQHWVETNGSWSCVLDSDTTTTTTAWSRDGSRSHAEEESTHGTGGHFYSVQEYADTSMRIFDGFGEYSLGVVVDCGTVAAHDRVVAIEERDDMPTPDVWDLSGFRKWRPDLHPRDHRNSVTCRSNLRIVPILDYNGSYLYREDEDEEESE